MPPDLLERNLGMSPRAQRTCVFKRCPETEYVPRESVFAPDIYALDLNDWVGVVSLQRAILGGMSYLNSGIRSISYHLLGEGCDTQRSLENLFTDPIQHAPQRRSKGFLIHLKLESKQDSQGHVRKTVKSPQKVALELAFHEGEQFDAMRNNWKHVTAYAWDSGASSNRIKIDPNMLIARLPERFREEILNCASQDQSFTTHYVHDNRSNVMFTSAVTIDGVLVSLDDRMPNEQTVSDIVIEDDDNTVQASVVIPKINI